MQEMSNQNEIEVKITASTNDLNSELQQAEQKVKSTAADMSESAKAIKATFNDIKNTLKNIDFKIHADTAALQTTMQGVVNTIKTRLQAASDQAIVKIKIDKSNLSAELASVRTQIQTRLSSIPPQKIKLQVDTAAVQSSLQGVVAGLPLVSININLSHLQTQINAARTILSSAFSSNTAAIKLKIDRTHLQAELALVRTRINSFFATSVNGIRLKISVTQADLAAARAKILSLTTTTIKAKIGIDLAYLNAQIALARTMLGSVGSSLNINIDATATGLIAALNNLKAEIVRLITSLNASGGGGGGGGGGSGGGPTILGGISGKLAGLFAGYLGVTGAVAAFNKTISSQREFDILNAQLETATKSLEGSKIAFSALQDFAKKTPYSLNQAVEGFSKLVNLGLTPSERAMVSYGNTASAMGKDLMQFIEAVADASTSEFERLKEFGIKAKQQGDKVSLTFQGVTKTIGNNAKEIEEYLIAIGENEFAGAMAKRVDTLDGAIASLSDTWDALFRAVSNLGVGDVIKEAVNTAENSISDLIKVLESGAVESALSGMATAFNIFSDDSKADMQSMASAFSGLGDFLVDTWRNTLREINALGNIFNTARSYVQKAAIGVAAGVDIVTDPFNKRTTNQQKNENYQSSMAGVDAQRANRVDAVKNGFDQAGLLREYQRLMSDEEKGKKKVGDALAQFKIPSGKTLSAQGGGKGSKESKSASKSNAEKSQMRDLGADLEAQKTQWENQQNSAGTLQEFPIEKVKEYWQNVLATKKLSADDRLKVDKSLADATRSIRQRSLNDELTTMRQETQSYGQNITAKLIKAQAYAERLKAIYGEQSNEYKQALQEQQQLEQDIKQKSYETSLRESEHRQQLKLNEVDAAEAQMQHEYDLGLVSDRKRLEELRAFEQKRYEITQAAIKERITLYDAENERTNGRMSTDDRVKMVDQGDANEAGHTQNQKGFDYQAEAQKMESMFGGLSDRVSGLWDKGLQAMINGTLTWRSAMNGIFMEMGAFFVQKIVTDPLKHYLAGLARKQLVSMGFISADVAATVTGEAAKTGAVVAGESARTGATVLGSAMRMATKVMETIGSIMLSAYEAMAGAWAAMVRIPFVGPVIAPVVAAGAFAGVVGLVGKIKSASGGYDIPSGVNPMTQLHEEEMVLPKPYANVIRDMASNGGAQASGGSSAMGGTVEQNNFNISALDAKSLKKLLRQNPAAVAGGLKAYGRNFGSR